MKLLISIILSLPLSFAHADILAGFENWGSLNGKYQLTDVGGSLGNLHPIEGLYNYISPELDTVYGEFYPWVFSAIYGWIYVHDSPETIVYIPQLIDFPVNYPTTGIPAGWYAFGKIVLKRTPEVVQNFNGYWSQMIYSFETGEWIEVNLGWFYHTTESSLIVPFETVFHLAFDQEVTVGSENLRIRFSEVNEDSRCPVDVICAWAGRLVVRGCPKRVIFARGF